MNLNELKKDLQNLLASSQLKDLINLGLQWTRNQSTPGVEITQLSGRFHQLERDNSLGTVSFGDYNQEINRIRVSLSKWVTDLKEDDILDHSVAPFKKLVIKNDDSHLSRFFDRTGLKGFEIEKRKEFHEEDLEKYCLIIFDNDNLPPYKAHGSVREEHCDQMSLMDAYLAKVHDLMENGNTDKKYAVFLHFGDENYLVSKYRKYIHAANSIFSLYARIMEVLDFLRIDTPANYVKKD